MHVCFGSYFVKWSFLFQLDSIWDTNELSMAFLGTIGSTGEDIMGGKIPKTKASALTKQRAWMPGQHFYF